MTKEKEGPFNADYVDYWKKRVASASVDGSKVADFDILDFYISKTGISQNDRVLDLGCGYGRLFPVLSRYAHVIIGVDMSPDMLADATKLPYVCLVEGKMEKTALASGSINRIVCWATFDVVEQEEGLVEANRLLATDGTLLLTGKNLSYCPDDRAAYVAERNAKLKNFPNHFTDVRKLLKGAGAEYGFTIDRVFGFPRRGDHGQNRYVEGDKIDLNACYEFILILRKTGLPCQNPPKIAYEFSSTATAMAEKNGFGSEVRKFFAVDKERSGD